MRHVALTTVAAFTALVAIVACEEQAPDRTLTAPDVSFAKGIGGACDDGRARLIGTQQADIWARPALDSAQNRFDLVKAACIGTPTSTTKSLMHFPAVGRSELLQPRVILPRPIDIRRNRFHGQKPQPAANESRIFRKPFSAIFTIFHGIRELL